MSEVLHITIVLLEILGVTEETKVTDSKFRQELKNPDEVFVTTIEGDDNPLCDWNDDE